MSRNKNLTREKAFDQTARDGPKAFGNALRDIIKRSGRAGLKDTHVVFIDKNHPHNNVSRVVNDIH